MKTALEIQALIAAEHVALAKGEAVGARHHFLVCEHNLDDLKSKLDKMSRRAVKLSMEPVTYTIGDYLDETLVREREDGSKRKILVRKYAVEIHGTRPVLAGYIFAGTIQHLSSSETGKNENIIRCILPDLQPPLSYRTASNKCEHCHTIRRRTDTHLVYHSATGTWKQIGTNCLVDFLGSVEADTLARQAEHLWEALVAAGEGEEEGFGGAKIKPRYSVLEVLVLTTGAIKQYGWISKSKAKEYDKTATADIVYRNLWDDESKLKKDGMLILAESCSKEEAEKALVWASEISDADTERSDYMYNLRVISKAGTIEPRLFGYTCSIVSGYNRTIAQEQERKLRPVSNFVGEIGKREIFTLTVVSMNSLESEWGVTHLYLFTDSEGNRLKWFGSSILRVKDEEAAPPLNSDGSVTPGAYIERDVVVGEIVTVKATVKSHDVYCKECAKIAKDKAEYDYETGRNKPYDANCKCGKGMKQTNLSRVATYVAPAPKVKKARAKGSKGENLAAGGEVNASAEA